MSIGLALLASDSTARQLYTFKEGGIAYTDSVDLPPSLSV
jgi:hypothetical protein